MSESSSFSRRRCGVLHPLDTKTILSSRIGGLRGQDHYWVRAEWMSFGILYQAASVRFRLGGPQHRLKDYFVLYPSKTVERSSERPVDSTDPFLQANRDKVVCVCVCVPPPLT